MKFTELVIHCTGPNDVKVWVDDEEVLRLKGIKFEAYTGSPPELILIPSIFGESEEDK